MDLAVDLLRPLLRHSRPSRSMHPPAAVKGGSRLLWYTLLLQARCRVGIRFSPSLPFAAGECTFERYAQFHAYSFILRAAFVDVRGSTQ